LKGAHTHTHTVSFSVMFILYRSHVCDTAWIGHQCSNMHVSQFKKKRPTHHILDTVSSALSDGRLNLDDNLVEKGK